MSPRHKQDTNGTQTPVRRFGKCVLPSVRYPTSYYTQVFVCYKHCIVTHKHTNTSWKRSKVLVLTRTRKNREVTLEWQGVTARVVVLEWDRDRVVLGFDAPKEDVAILREEARVRIPKEQLSFDQTIEARVATAYVEGVLA